MRVHGSSQVVSVASLDVYQTDPVADRLARRLTRPVAVLSMLMAAWSLGALLGHL